MDTYLNKAIILKKQDQSKTYCETYSDLITEKRFKLETYYNYIFDIINCIKKKM